MFFLLLAACRPDPTPQDSGPEVEPYTCPRTQSAPLEPLALSAARVDKGTDWIDPMAGSGVGVGDLDGDGLRDLLIPQLGTDQILLQTPGGDFVDATADLWPEVRDQVSAAAHMVDIDGDDDLDVFVCHSGQPGQFEAIPNALYLNDGSGHLTDVSEAWGVDQMTRPCYGASFGDIDGDGDLDVALANYDPCAGDEECARILEWPSPQLLWRQTPDGFEDVSERLGDLARTSLPYVAALLDVDGDHDLDVYLVNDTRRDISFAEPSRLFLNDGSGGMKWAGEGYGSELHLEAMGLGLGDVNGDLALDMVIPAVRQFALLVSSSAGGGWFDEARARGLVVPEDDTARYYAWGTELADLDNDADLDVLAVFGYLLGEPGPQNPEAQPDALYLNADGDFSQVAEAWGFDDDGIGRGLLVIDLDGDGWLDVLKRELEGPVRAYRGRCDPDMAWLEVALRQPGPNTRAIGATVTVEAGAQVLRRWVVLGGHGFASSGDGAVHFGLGTAQRIQRLTVTWPDGEETVLTDLVPWQAITVVR